ncbi:MAG: hypothetical protein ACR2PS_18520 [Pseudomonadales bacterium]
MTKPVEFTCPILVQGLIVAEFEAGIEVDVTYYGKPITYGSPAEGPEWEVVSYYVDGGKYDFKQKKYNPHWVPAPDDLKAHMETYMASREGRNDIAVRIKELVNV